MSPRIERTGSKFGLRPHDPAHARRAPRLEVPAQRAERRLRVFIDTSVWVAGIASERGAAREILRLAEAGLVRPVASEQVLVELDRVITAKFPQFTQEVLTFLSTVRPEVRVDPTGKDLKPFLGLIEEGDVAILAAAHLAGVDYLVTWDKKDFLKATVRRAVSCGVEDPGGFLKAFREHQG